MSLTFSFKELKVNLVMFNNLCKAVYDRIFSGFLTHSHGPTNDPFYSEAYYRTRLIRVPHCTQSYAVTLKCIFLQWISALDPEKFRFPALLIHVFVVSPHHLLSSFIL